MTTPAATPSKGSSSSAETQELVVVLMEIHGGREGQTPSYCQDP